MVDIEIEQETGRRVSITLPEKWSELSKKQFVGLMAIFTSDLPQLEKYFAAMFVLGNRSRKQLRKWQPCEAVAITEHLAWINRLNDFVLDDSLVKWVGIAKGPNEYMFNTLVGQFEDADYCIQGYFNDPDNAKDYAKMLLAVLYRPFGLPYNRWIVQHLWVYVINWFSSDKVRVASLMNYVGLRRSHKEVFSFFGGGDGESSVLDNFGYSQLIDSVAGDKLGTIAQVRKLSIKELFIHLQNAHEQAERLKDQTLGKRVK